MLRGPDDGGLSRSRRAQPPRPRRADTFPSPKSRAQNDLLVRFKGISGPAPPAREDVVHEVAPCRRKIQMSAAAAGATPLPTAKIRGSSMKRLAAI